MAITVRGNRDEVIDRLGWALETYQRQHHAAEIIIRRQNSVTISIRVIDPDFASLHRADRHDILWDCLVPLAEEDQSQVSILLALTPAEAKSRLPAWSLITRSLPAAEPLLNVKYDEN